MRIHKLFEDLSGRKAIIPFVTAGDPDLETTREIMKTLAQNGADIIELGVPFSDPMADGPVIQLASERALAHNTSLQDVLSLVKSFRDEGFETPVVLMGYMNPFYHMGFQKFATQAKASGVDGVLMVDCPVEYVEPFQKELDAQNLDTIFLIAPTTTDDRVKEILAHARGYVYYVSLKGVTGSNELNMDEVKEKVQHFKSMSNVPIAVGFGIKDGKTAKEVAKVSDAVVIGSYFVDTIFKNPKNECEALKKALVEIRNEVDSLA